MTAWLVCLGGHALNAGWAEVAERRKARLLIVDWNDHPTVTGDRHLQLDIKDTPRVLQALATLEEPILFAYTSSDVATETVARINAHLGLGRPPEIALTAARSKALMNELWNRAGLLNKEYRRCSSLSELCEFRRCVAGDLVVKPVSASSSRGVTVLAEAAGASGLANAWHRATGNDPAGQALAEQFIAGTEMTVEMLGDGRGNVCVWAVSRKYHTPHAGANRIATKIHYNPPGLSHARQAECAAFGAACYRALGLRNCLGHFELIERPSGELVPVELGARSSGFIATHLADAVVGGEPRLLDEYERVLRGGSVKDGLLTPSHSAMYFWYDFPPGVGRSTRTLLDYLPSGIASLASDRSRLLDGERFAPIDSESERYGYEILVGDPSVLTIDTVMQAEAAHLRSFLEPWAPELGAVRQSA